MPIFPRVRAFPGGGAPKPPQLHYDLKREVGGIGIVSGYGLTECPIIAMNCIRDPDEKLAHTEGRRSPPEAEIRVVRLDGGLAAPGKEGELWVPSRPVKTIVSSVGAGGAFCAGMLYGLHEEWPLAQCMDLAHAAAGACLGHETTTDGLRPISEL